MTALRPDVDPDGLMEYSVVYTDRALNHMSKSYQSVMNDISSTLKTAYNAEAIAIVPGGGTYAMEAVARQVARGQRCQVLRNGWFSYRWTQILDATKLSADTQVLKATKTGTDKTDPFTSMPIDELCAAIKEYKPDVFFAPHVETSAGVILPDEYIRRIGEAVKAVNGIFVLDCIASGTVWVDVKALGVDILISAPQKGWSGPACAGLVMLGDRGLQRVRETQSDSFACDLKKWLEIMEAYEKGGHAYHATMPTDALREALVQMKATEALGFANARKYQEELGQKVRAMLAKHGFKSVAAEEFAAPGVVVVYTDNPAIQNGSKFAAQGLQVAAGVPLMVDEGADFCTVRMGLFGLDKLTDIDGTVQRLEKAVTAILEEA